MIKTTINEGAKMKKLKNSKLRIEYNENKKELFGQDLTDKFNLPACYNKGSRSIKKAWATLCEKFNEDTSMSQAIDILNQFGMKMRIYCMMD